jgi:hypothetical protein
MCLSSLSLKPIRTRVELGTKLGLIMKNPLINVRLHGSLEVENEPRSLFCKEPSAWSERPNVFPFPLLSFLLRLLWASPGFRDDGPFLHGGSLNAY